MGSSDDEDGERIRRAREGDARALDELFQRHYRSVYNLAYRLTGNQDDTHDIVQDSCVRVQQALPNFRGDANSTTWLYRIVTATFLDERRKRRQRAHGWWDGAC
jgi:RNA polymerase sigma-70 factor (ECF subfamily)